MAEKTLYLMRHGETDMNRQRRLQGQINCALNENGLAEAKETAKLLRNAGISFTEIYSSPLSRAMDTAAAVSGGVPVIAEPLIMEMSFGRYEGVEYSSLGEELWSFIHDPENIPAPEGVETKDSITSRTGQFLRRVISDGKEGNVLAVTHGIALRSMLWNLYPGSKRHNVWSMPIGNCVIYRCTVRDGAVTDIRRADELCTSVINDTSRVF